MKKNFAWIGILVGLALFVSTLQVSAAPLPTKPTPNSHGNKGPDAKQNSQEAKKGKVSHYRGTVSAASATSLSLTLKDGSSLTFGIDGQTTIKIPTVQNATWENLNLGVEASVQAKADSSGALTARKILVVPGKPAKIHRVGVVSAYTAGASITITAKDGGTYTFKLTPDTKILPAQLAASLKVGSKVTIISRRDPTGGVLTAQGIVIHAEEEDTSSN